MKKKTEPDVPFRVTKDILLPGVLFAFLVRWCVACYPYSGYNSPPMYGDYEAQRHWQEITIHLPPRDWYRNTTQNDLQYWGLDYPPLTAYHSYLIGVIMADWLDPESVQLFASRGYESETHKTYMRWTVILSDFYFFINAVMSICYHIEREKTKDEVNIFKRTDFGTFLFLLYPGIILIDHGHFQYNCVSLGLFLWATSFLIFMGNHVLATVAFTLALNFKQMELYHALPFFFYLLRHCFVPHLHMNKRLSFIKELNKLAVAVVSVFIILWFPFMGSWSTIKQVVIRLFPLNRGVFEDKVSNFWCLVNTIVKLKTLFTNEQMAKICLIVTGLAVTPSCFDLFFRCNKKKFVLSVINVSLAFFLFSFQVHEKSILLVAIPVCMYLPEDPFFCFWFLLVSNFSMLPLMIKDGLIKPFVITNLLYYLVYAMIFKMSNPMKYTLADVFSAERVYGAIKPNRFEGKHSQMLMLWSLAFGLSLVGMVCLVLMSALGAPPERYPDLFPLLVSVYSCLHFLGFFLYLNMRQFSIPMLMPTVQKFKFD